MKRTPILSLLIVAASLLPLSACFLLNDDDDDCDPNLTCNTVEPSNATISVALTIDDENPWVPLEVYQGNASDSILYLRDTATGDISWDLPVDQRYSVVAKYRQGSRTVLAVDGGKISTSSFTNCGETCWTTDDLNLNLRLLK